MTRHIALGLLMSVLATGLTACGSPAAHPGKTNGVDLMDEAGRNAEYHALASTYPWPLPSGVTFPDALVPAEEPTVYEVGEGANQADTFWICAWMTEWMRTRRTEPKAARTAWAWVERSDKTQLHTKHYYDPRDVWHKEILEPAAQGQVANFREFLSTSCAYPQLAKSLQAGRQQTGP